MEIYDIETWDYKIKNSIDYLGHQIFSFEFQILEAKDNDDYIYFCAFSHDDNYDDNGVLKGYEKGFKGKISRFQFSFFSFDKTKVTKGTIETLKYTDRVITGFVIEEKNLVAVIFVKEFDRKNKFMINYYNFDMTKVYNDYIKLYEFGLENLVEGQGIYFKPIYLTNNFLAFSYFDDKSSSKSYKFILIKLFKDKGYSSFEDQISKDLNTYDLIPDKNFNRFYKI